MRKYCFSIGLVVGLILAFSPLADARDLIASMAQLPVLIEDKDTGAFVDLVRAIDDAYTQGRIIRAVYPFKRSLNNVLEGHADFHIPLIKNPLVPEAMLPFRYAGVPTGPVAFVIYSHKDHPIDRRAIDVAARRTGSAFPYRIDTLQGHTEFFNFPVVENYDFESALKRVSIKRIDAVIMPQEECDSVLRGKKIPGIHRSLYEQFDSMIVIPKGERGDEIDRILIRSIEKLKSDGRLERLNARIHNPFIEWQPFDEGF